MNASAPEGGITVLYIHPAPAFSGAARSLLELLRGFPEGAVRACVLAPDGAAAAALAAQGASVVVARGLAQFDSTRFGYYRGLRWLIVLRELWLLPITLAGVLRARRRWPAIDLIHANEITMLPAALFAKLLYRRPLVVHVRSVQLTEGAPLRRRLVRGLLRRHADAIVAIDDTVRASLPPDFKVAVVHNGFSPETPAGRAELSKLKARLNQGSLRVGMAGSLLAMKGVREFLEAARLCAARGANVDFVIAGLNPRDLSGTWGRLLRRLGFAHDMEAEIRGFAAAHGLEARLHRIGFISDVAELYRLLDVVCFPSHLGAVGRPVIEAAWLGVPCIAAAAPASDTFIPGETGYVVPPRDPGALAQAILRLEADRGEVKRMGEGALRLARKNFDGRRNAAEILALYGAVREARKRSALAA